MEFKVLLGLLRCYLWNTEEVKELLPIKEKQWRGVFERAKDQAVAGVAFEAMNRLPEHLRPPKNIWLHWMEVWDKYEQRNKEISRVTATVLNILRQKGMRPILLKGQSVGAYYPTPLRRCPGDIDVLVGEEGFKRMEASEQKKGDRYAREREKHLEFSRNEVTVEFHRKTSIFYLKEQGRRYDEMERGWLENGPEEREIEGIGKVAVLPVGFEVLFLFVHGFMHFVPDRLRLRQLMDWVVLLKANNNKVDLERLMKEVELLGLRKGFEAFGYAAVNGLGMPKEWLPQRGEHCKKSGEWLLKDIEKGGGVTTGRLRRWYKMLSRSIRMKGLFGYTAVVYPLTRGVNFLRKKCRIILF